MVRTASKSATRSVKANKVVKVVKKAAPVHKAIKKTAKVAVPAPVVAAPAVHAKKVVKRTKTIAAAVSVRTRIIHIHINYFKKDSCIT